MKKTRPAPESKTTTRQLAATELRAVHGGGVIRGGAPVPIVDEEPK